MQIVVAIPEWNEQIYSTVSILFRLHRIIDSRSLLFLHWYCVTAIAAASLQRCAQPQLALIDL